MDGFDGFPFGIQVIFRLNRHSMFFDDEYECERERNPWADRAEKSTAASRRENEAKGKFDFLRSQMELALYENTMTTIGLACHATSKSPLKLLPKDVMEHVLGFSGCTKPTRSAVKTAAAGRSGLAIVPLVGWRQKKNAPDETPLNLADVSLFQPGIKIVIPLTKPNLHLTGPCYRDLRKHVHNYANWDVRRTAATEHQKQEYKESRKGTVYFINAIYSVSRKAPGKRKRGKLATAAGGGKKKSPPELLLSSGTQGKATFALQAAIQSAASDANGNVEPEIFQRALDAGYSKHFILGNLDSLKDTKLPAKKTKQVEEEE